MANYDQLFVYKSCYQLLFSLHKDLNKIPRDIKYTLLQDLKKDTLFVLRQIYHANSAKEKIPILELAIDRMFDVKINIRILWDLKVLGLKQFGRFLELAESVSKQLTCWKKSEEKKEMNNLQQMHV